MIRRVHPVPFFLILSMVGLVLVGEAATKADIKDVAGELACLCGTCPHRPLDECSCGFAGQKRDEIARLLDGGKDKDAIIAGFIDRGGLQVLAAPPAEGFNLLAWVMPFAALAVGGFKVRSVIRGWARGKEERPPAPGTESSEDDPYRSRLESELRGRDS
jgi:cytochrome c-type biogenesis protein CcmH